MERFCIGRGGDLRLRLATNHGRVRSHGSLAVPIRRNGNFTLTLAVGVVFGVATWLDRSTFQSRFAVDRHITLKLKWDWWRRPYTRMGRHSWNCLKMLSSS